MSVDRLFETVYYLMNHRITTAKVLAEHFEVSTRTVYRDLQRLVVAGFPIYTHQGVSGGIYLDDDFVLDKTIFKLEEQRQILMALQSIEKLQGLDDNVLIDKMASLFNQTKLDWLEVDFNTWHYNNDLNNKFSLIKQAILHHYKMSFIYHDSYGNKTERIAAPCKLFFKANTWYMQGYCLTKVAYRTFRLSRITNLEIVPEVFFQEALPPKITPIIKSEKMITVTLKFDAMLASTVFDEFGEDTIKQDEGKYLVTALVADNEWLLSFILSFGSLVEVVAPQMLKDKLLAEVAKIKKVYF